MRAPKNEPAAPTTGSKAASPKSTRAAAKWGISAENEGGVTASAFIAAARLDSNPTRMRVGNSRNPGRRAFPQRRKSARPAEAPAASPR
jgi:hypothetical protein